MVSIYEAAVSASIIMGLISIPAASQSVASGENLSLDLGNISGVDSPETVSTGIGPEGFTSVLNTAFTSYSSNVSSGGVSTSLEDPVSRLDVKKTPSSTVWTLTTPEGRLKVSGSSSRTVQRLETADGTLEVTLEGGRETRSFSGVNRDEVEQTFNRLKKEMRAKKREMEQKSDRVQRSTAPEVVLDANESLASGFGDNTREHVMVRNAGIEPVSIAGWSLEDSAGDSYSFDDLELPAGSVVRVYSSDEEEIDGCPGTCVYGSGISWNNDGDAAKLKDASGSTVASVEYG